MDDIGLIVVSALFVFYCSASKPINISRLVTRGKSGVNRLH